MLDLFQENKIVKVKGVSLSNKPALKKIARMEYRNNICIDAIKEFPKENEVSSFVSKGLSDAGSFLNAVYQKEGAIKEAVICTWTISKTNIQRILDFVDEGKIEKLYFLINDGLLNTNSTKPIYAFLRLEFDKRKDKISYAVANTHAKIQMYKTNEKYITISGSGNWSENPRIENYILIGGAESYNFNSGWVKDLMNG